MVLITVLTGCRQKEEIQVYRIAKEGSGPGDPAMPADPHADLSLGGPSGAGLPPGHPPTRPTRNLSAEVPEGWEAGKVSSMREASYSSKGNAGEMADISLVILAGTAGGLLENVNIWRSQLGQGPLEAAALEPVTARLPTNLGEAVVVDLEGLAEGADPLADGRIVAAMVARPGEAWFFKMRGNAELVGAQKEGFLAWVASHRPGEDKDPGESEGEPVAGVGKNAGSPQAPIPPRERDQVKWQVPAGWSEGPPKTMRLVTFLVTGPGGEGGEVTVVKLAGDGGGTLANLNRWRGQIGLPPIEAGALAGTIGTVQAGGLEMSQAAMAGPDGSTVAVWGAREAETWFFKLSGPAAVVEAQRENFAGFLKSVEFVNE